jgi:hypothetical protein
VHRVKIRNYKKVLETWDYRRRHHHHHHTTVVLVVVSKGPPISNQPSLKARNTPSLFLPKSPTSAIIAQAFVQAIR